MYPYIPKTNPLETKAAIIQYHNSTSNYLQIAGVLIGEILEKKTVKYSNGFFTKYKLAVVPEIIGADPDYYLFTDDMIDVSAYTYVKAIGTAEPISATDYLDTTHTPKSFVWNGGAVVSPVDSLGSQYPADFATFHLYNEAKEKMSKDFETLFSGLLQSSMMSGSATGGIGPINTSINYTTSHDYELLETLWPPKIKLRQSQKDPKLYEPKIETVDDLLIYICD